jgi:hypothetical protein
MIRYQLRVAFALPEFGSRCHPVRGRGAHRLLVLALGCVLLLAGSSADAVSLAAEQPTSLDQVPDRAAAPVRAVPKAVLRLARLHSRFTLRTSKSRHIVYVAPGWDDPNDDETSDDPNDDDDGWDDLSGIEETEVPIAAWLPRACCYVQGCESRSDLSWAQPLLLTSFLKLGRLRC